MAIEEAPQDKMMKAKDAETKDVAEVAPPEVSSESTLNEYFFPEYGTNGKTVRAASYEEALVLAQKDSDNK